jgi:hypothetical protein
MLVDTYKKNTRKAEIYKSENGFYVKLYENDSIVDIVKLDNKSIHYAESCAENYVERIGTFYQ